MPKAETAAPVAGTRTVVPPDLVAIDSGVRLYSRNSLQRLLEISRNKLDDLLEQGHIQFTHVLGDRTKRVSQPEMIRFLKGLEAPALPDRF